MSNGTVVNLQSEAAKQLSQEIGNTVSMREQVQTGSSNAQAELDVARQELRTKLASFAADKKPLNEVIQFYTQWKGTTQLPLINKGEAMKAYEDGITVKINEYKEKHPQEFAQVLMGILHELQRKYDKESKEAGQIKQQIEAIRGELEYLHATEETAPQVQTEVQPSRKTETERPRRS
jgi:hypothetical protein